jgi:hypothetical protein
MATPLSVARRGWAKVPVVIGGDASWEANEDEEEITA